MRIEAVELVRFEIPLAAPFRTSFGIQRHRDVVLVRVISDQSEGWGENVAGALPSYASEFTDASVLALRDHLIPRLAGAREITARELHRRLAPVRGWEMAKCALECALLDAELRSVGRSLASELGATTTTIRPGVSVGLHDSIAETVAEVEDRVRAGYERVKLKIEPGRDVEVVAAVRAHLGPDFPLQVDANAAYTLADAPRLAELDRFGLLLIEQPLADGDLRQHALLAGRLSTPLCLDESITSVERAADAIALGSCSIINIKPGRVGGYLESRRIHDLCAANGVPVWCGGMLETGIGRAANLALAALPNFTLPPDISASSRYFAEDITEPFELIDGGLSVPEGPGIGIAPDPAQLAALGATTERVL